MSNLRIQPGEILWLERNEETKRVFAGDEGILGHPVVVLGIDVKGDGVERSRHIQINIVTSFGGQLLQKRHPGKGKREIRTTYIPIHRRGWPKELHPDTKQALSIETVGNPKVPCEGRTSYVSLRKPIYVGKEHLSGIFEGKANLTFKSLQSVVKQVNVICAAGGVKQVPAPKNRPRTPELQPAPIQNHRIIELDSEENSDSDSHNIVPNRTIEWCESGQHLYYYPIGQVCTVIHGERPSRVPLGQRNPNTVWKSNQSAARTPTVQTARPIPVPQPLPAQRAPLLEPYYQKQPNYGLINGSGSPGDLEAARQPPASWPPEPTPEEAEPTEGGFIAAIIVIVLIVCCFLF